MRDVRLLVVLVCSSGSVQHKAKTTQRVNHFSPGCKKVLHEKISEITRMLNTFHHLRLPFATFPSRSYHLNNAVVSVRKVPHWWFRLAWFEQFGIHHGEIGKDFRRWFSVKTFFVVVFSDYESNCLRIIKFGRPHNRRNTNSSTCMSASELSI